MAKITIDTKGLPNVISYVTYKGINSALEALLPEVANVVSEVVVSSEDISKKIMKIKILFSESRTERVDQYTWWGHTLVTYSHEDNFSDKNVRLVFWSLVRTEFQNRKMILESQAEKIGNLAKLMEQPRFL